MGDHGVDPAAVVQHLKALVADQALQTALEAAAKDRAEARAAALETEKHQRRSDDDDDGDSVG